MSKKEITLTQDEVWQMIDFALKLGSWKWDIPNGAYKPIFEVSDNDIQLVLVEVPTPPVAPTGGDDVVES